MANQIQYKVGFDVQQQDLNKLKSSLQQLQKMKISDLMKINDTDFKSAENYLNNIRNQAINVQNALKQAFNTKLNTVNIESFNKVLKDSGSSIDKVYASFSKAGTAGQNAFRSLSSQVLSTNIQLKETHGILDKMATTLANTIKWNMASTAINGMTRSVQQAWGYVKSLDTSLNDIRIVTGKSADEMGKFAVQANNAAKQLGKTTTDYTNAALIYAQQGLSDKEIEERAKITLKAANVTGQSTDAVSEELTAVWNGYKVTAEQAELYVDRLAAVAAKSASNLEELSTGMSKVASAAAAMGVGEEQLAAQLSTIISVTRQAPESVGTALRTVYARISDIKAGIDEDGVTLGNYSGKMAELGFNVLDMNGNLRDMGEVMEEIGGRWGDLTREQQVYLAQTMAGQRQYNNLLALFDNFERYNEMLGVAQNAAGTLQTQQDTYMESTAAHLQQLKAATEDIYDSLADTDTINGLIDGLKSVASLTATFVDSVGGGGAVLSSLGAIGVTVFSEQIAKGLGTTITNLEIGKENARQFGESLQTVKEWRGIEGLDKTSDQLLANREQLLELARLMTPEQFNGMQTLLNDITSLGNEIQTIQSKIQPLQTVLKDFTNTPLTDVLGNGKEIDNIIEKINDPIDSLDKLQQKIKDAKQSFRDAFSSASVLFDRTKVDDFNNVFTEAQSNITSFLDSIHDLRETDAFKGMSEPARAAFDDIENKWEHLIETFKTVTPENSTQAQQEFKDFFDLLSKTVSSSSGQIKRKYEELLGILGNPQAILTLQQQQQKLKKMVDDFISGQTRMQKVANIENYAKMAGGIAQVGSAIRQIQNLGSIWKNEDLSTGQKLLQTITNLSFSLPMLATGFTKATTALGLMEVMETKEAVTAGYSTAAEAAHALSIKMVDKASGEAVIKLQLLNKTLLLNPYVAIAAAAIAAATAIGVFVKRSEQANKALAENAQKRIEEENTKQQEIEKNKQFLTSLKQLNEQRKNDQISRSEMKSAIQDLIEQYGLEGEQVDKLAQSYDNLSKYISEARQKQAQQGKESAQREKDAAIQQVTSRAKGKAFDAGYQSGERYYLKIKSGISSSDEPEQIRQLLQKAGGVTSSNGGDFNFGTNFDSASIVELYDNLQLAIDEMHKLRDAGQITQAQLQKSEYYQNTIKWIEQMRESVERYKAAEEDVAKYNAELTAITAENTGVVDFSDENIKNGNDYLKQRAALITEIQQKLGKKKSQAADIADTYLRDNFKDLYVQFDEVAKFIDNLQKKFGELPEGVESALDKLDEDHLTELLKLDPSLISDWDDLAEIITKISKVDFSNVSEKIKTSPEEAKTAATQQYNIYDSLEDQIFSGKSISSKELERLEPQVQQFFKMMANGSYKMTGDAKEFYELVNNLKLDGFRSALSGIEEELTKVKTLSEQNFNYDELNQNASQKTQLGNGTVVRSSIDYDLVKDQIDYLQATGSELDPIIDKWEELAEKQELSSEQVDKIAEAVANVDDQTQNLKERQQELQQMSKEVTDQLHDAMFPTDEDVDTEVLQKLTELYEQQADKIEGVNDAIKGNAEWAQEAAQAVLRFDDAIQNVIDNYEDWIKVLESGNEAEYAKIANDLQDAYSDLLDFAGNDALSDSFLQSASNLNLMKQAIDGNVGSYDELMQLAQEDIISNITINDDSFWANKNAIEQSLMSLQNSGLTDIQIDAALNQGNFIDSLNSMIAATDMTATQVQNLLTTMGFNAKVVEKQPQVKETATENQYWQPATYTTETIPTGGEFMPGSYTQLVLDKPGEWISKPGKTSSVIPGTGAVQVQTLHGVSGGDIKFQQAPSGGGSAGQARRSGGSGGGGKGKGGGGGGKGKASEPDKSKKDRKKPLEDNRDLYHDINIELGQMDRNLSRIQKQQEKLYGKEVLSNLKQQTAILEKQREKLKEKQKIQQEDLKDQQKELKELGATFDQYGHISNYMDIIEKKRKKANALIKEENQLIKQYNKETNKDVKKAISDEITKQDKKVKEAEDKIKKLEDKIKDYDSLREDMEDLVDELDDNLQQEIELNIQAFRVNVEISLDLGEAERDWNQFRRNVLEHTDVIKDSDFKGIFSDATQSYRDLSSYFKVGNSVGSLEVLTNQIMKTRSQIESIDATGTSAIYGDNKAKAMEDLQNDLDELMGQMQDVKELIDDIDQAYLDTIDDVADQFDKQIEQYEYLGDLIQHDMDLLQLLYGDKNYDAMDKYYTTLEQNNLKQLDSLKRQREFWKNQWEAAAAVGDTKAAEQFKENYKKAITDLNQLIEQSAQTIQDKYINSIEKIFDELDKKISNGFGTDYLSTQWELINKNADQYLDTINSAFAIQQTERKYQQAIDDTKSIKSQQALKSLMQQQLDILKNKEKITQYDVDRAEKLLQVEQARIALQDAQSTKTSMRLKRDSQGNYSYEYVADNDAVNDAQSNLAKAQNDLYNFDKDRYQSNLDEMLAAWRDFQSEYKDILEDTSINEEERLERLTLLREQYGEYINGKTEENLVIRKNLRESAFADLAALYNTDVANYTSMATKEQEILMGSLVPTWENGISQMALFVAGQGGFIPACEQAFNNVTQATKDYQTELGEMSKQAGTDLSDVKTGIDELEESFSVLITDNSQLTTEMDNELNAVRGLREEAQQLADTYKAVYDNATRAVTGIQGFLKAQNEKNAKDNNKTGSNGSSDGNKNNKEKNTKKSDSNTIEGGLVSSSGGGGVGKNVGKDTQITDDLIEGIAGNIWLFGTWDTDPERENNMIKKFGKTKGKKIHDKVQHLFNTGYGYKEDPKHDRDYYKKYSLSSFRSGGYTGDWHNDTGKLAILHKKQMVLNQEDTKNILDSVHIMRSVMSNLSGNMLSRFDDIKTGYSKMMGSSGDTLEQNVHISASFPNVNSKKEIEEAFEDLVNLATQRVLRRR